MGVYLRGPHIGPIHSSVKLSGGKKGSGKAILLALLISAVIVFAFKFWIVATILAALVVGWYFVRVLCGYLADRLEKK